MRNGHRAAFSAFELFLAIALSLVLALAALVLVSGTTREAGVGEDLIHAHSVLHDMVEYYRGESAAFFKTSGFPSSEAQGLNTAQELVLSSNQLLSSDSFRPELKWNPDDAFQAEFETSMENTRLRRLILFEENFGGKGQSRVTAVVEWTSRAGTHGRLEQSFMVWD